MHDHITSITQKPTQNIHNKLKTQKKQKTKKTFKNPKPRSKCMNAWKDSEKKGLKRFTKWFELG